MTSKVYTFGYAGRKLGELERLVKELQAIVFDVRFSANSRNPYWSGANLQRVFGGRYKHVRALGNRNFKGKTIDIVDYDAGRELIRTAGRPVILMCVCKDYASCHRKVIAERLAADGFETEELPRSHEPAAKQRALF